MAKIQRLAVSSAGEKIRNWYGHARIELNEGTNLCRLFDRVVSQVYTIDAAHAPENRITGILAPTADRILEMFLLQGGESEAPFEALFYSCYIVNEVLEAKGSDLELGFVTKAETWCQASLSLCERIVSARAIVWFVLILLN